MDRLQELIAGIDASCERARNLRAKAEQADGAASISQAIRLRGAGQSAGSPQPHQSSGQVPCSSRAREAFVSHQEQRTTVEQHLQVLDVNVVDVLAHLEALLRHRRSIQRRLAPALIGDLSAGIERLNAER
jgi:hypothetical protein